MGLHPLHAPPRPRAFFRCVVCNFCQYAAACAHHGRQSLAFGPRQTPGVTIIDREAINSTFITSHYYRELRLLKSTKGMTDILNAVLPKRGQSLRPTGNLKLMLIYFRGRRLQWAAAPLRYWWFARRGTNKLCKYPRCSA